MSGGAGATSRPKNRSRSRALLVGAAAAAIAAVAYQGRELACGKDTTEPAGPAARTEPAGSASAGAADEPPNPAAAGAGEEKRAATTSEARDPDVRPPPRDLRGAEATQPRPRRRGERVVETRIVADMRKALQPGVDRCRREFGEGLAANAQIQGTLAVSIRSGVLSVLDVAVAQRGVPGPAVCVFRHVEPRVALTR